VNLAAQAADAQPELGTRTEEGKAIDRLSVRAAKGRSEITAIEHGKRCNRLFRVSEARVSQLRRELCEEVCYRFVSEWAEVSGDGVMLAAW
jgi:hypothetical protein